MTGKMAIVGDGDSIMVFKAAGVAAFAIMLIVTIMDPSERVAMAFCAVCYVITYIIAYFYTKKHDVTAANLDL